MFKKEYIVVLKDGLSRTVIGFIDWEDRAVTGKHRGKDVIIPFEAILMITEVRPVKEERR